MSYETTPDQSDINRLLATRNDDRLFELLELSGTTDIGRKEFLNGWLDKSIPKTANFRDILRDGDIEISTDLVPGEHVDEVLRVHKHLSEQSEQNGGDEFFPVPFPASISNRLKIEELAAAEPPRTGNSAAREIGIPENSYTGALIDFPTRLTISRSEDGNQINIIIYGFDYRGRETIVSVSRDVDMPYYGRGWSRLLINREPVVSENSAGYGSREIEKSEALYYLLAKTINIIKTESQQQ